MIVQNQIEMETNDFTLLQSNDTFPFYSHKTYESIKKCYLSVPEELVPYRDQLTPEQYEMSCAERMFEKTNGLIIVTNKKLRFNYLIVNLYSKKEYLLESFLNGILNMPMYHISLCKPFAICVPAGQDKQIVIRVTSNIRKLSKENFVNDMVMNNHQNNTIEIKNRKSALHHKENILFINLNELAK